MSNRARIFRETTLNSAIKVVQERGLTVAGVKIDPDGTVNVLTSDNGPVVTADLNNPFDRKSGADRQAKIHQGVHR